MSAWVTVALLIVVAEIEVNLAPDQPVPHVYPDDPLIVEFLPETDVRATATVELMNSGDPPGQVTLGPLALRERHPYWAPLDGIAEARGHYRVRIRLIGNGVAMEEERTFCRIDRPLIPKDPALAASLANVEEKTLLALRGIPLGTVRLNGGQPGLEARMEKASGARFQVVLALNAIEDKSENLAEVLSRRFAGRVARWEVDAGPESERAARAAEAIRRGGSQAPIGLAVSDKETLVALLSQGASRYVQQVVYRHETPNQADVAALRDAAAAVGYEALPVTVLCRCAGDASAGPRLVQHLLLHRAADVVQTAIDGAVLYDSVDFQEGYAYLSALVHKLEGAVYVGELNLLSTVHAIVFRRDAAWVIGSWTTGPSDEVVLPLGTVSELRLTDALNNPLPVPPVTKGAVTLSAGSEPFYLSGRGGDVLLQAALCRVRKEAGEFTARAEFQGAFPAEVADLVASFVDFAGELPERLDFFALLRLFPFLEKRWHEGTIPSAAAVPAMASLGRIARSLCVIEQEKGEPFLEPLSKTLAQCSEYQTLYLTNAANASAASERGEWLLAEVSRLTGEAEELALRGRPIEAGALAALAEWRARAMKFAAGAGPLYAQHGPEPSPGDN